MRRVGERDVNRRWLLARRPTAMVDAETLRFEEAAIPVPGPNQVLVRVTHLSIDPTIRTWMNDAAGYLPPIAVGAVVRSIGIGEVVTSNSDQFAPGQLVYGLTGWQDY